MPARNAITVEFVGDTSKLAKASGQISTELVRDLQAASKDLARIAGRMADQFESKMAGVGSDAGARVAKDLKAQKGKFAAAGGELGESFSDRFSSAMQGVSGRVGTRIGPGFASLGGKLGGKLLGGFAALGIGALVAEQISAGMDLQAGVDKLQAQLGLTAKDAKQIGELAGDTYAGAWGESMEEVQGFYAATMRAFPKLTDEALKQVTESAATTADVWDQDFNEVVRAAQNLLVNGLAPDAQTAMDMVATALQKTKGPQDEVLMSLKEYSDHFAVVGLDGANVIGGLTSKWAANEYAIDKVGDAVKELGIRTLDGSDTTKEGLEAIGLSVGEVEAAFAKGGDTAGRMTERIIKGIIGIEDPAERARAGVALMGTPFEDLGKNAVPILRDVVKGQKDLTDTVEVGNEAYDNARTKLTAWKRKGLQVVTEFIGNEAIPAIEDFAGDVDKFARSKGIDKFVDHWLDELSTWLDDSDEYREKWAGRWNRGLGRWLRDTDDYEDKWERRWNRGLGGWLRDTDGYQDKWGNRWDRFLGGWLDDTDDYKERWHNRWDRSFGRWLGLTRDRHGKWREGWRGALGKWLSDTDDWKQKWLNRMTGAYSAVKRTVIEPLMRLWNRVSQPFGGPQLGGGGGGGSRGGSFHSGGEVPGTGTGDTVPAWLEPGEHVLTRGEVKAAGGHRVIHRIRHSLRTGRGMFDPPTGGDPQRFAEGGIVAAARFAKAQSGEPYRWGGVGPYGYDCSGFMSAILNVLQGKYPYSRRFTTSTINAGGGLKAGLGPRGGFSIGSYYGNPGHMAGTLGGVAVEAGGTSGNVGYGGDASNASHPRFNRHFHASGAGIIDFTKVIREGVDRILDRVEARISGGFWERLARGMATTARSRMIAKVDSFEHGTDYVPYTGLAKVHRGERITPANRNRGGPTIVVNLNVAGSVRSEKDLVAVFRREIKNMGGLRSLGRM